MKRLLICCICVFLYSCATSIQKTDVPVDVKALDVKTLLELGQKETTRWENEKDLNALMQAQMYYQAALKELPDNINLQKAYYSNLYLLSINDWLKWHQKLENHFTTVNPLIKPNLSPPALLEFNYLHGQNASGLEQINALKKAVNEQPESSRSWYALSTKFEANKQYQLALYSALRAIKIEEELPEFIFQVGDLYNILAAQQECVYNNPELSKKSVRYTAKAAALKSENVLYQRNLALLYSRLGLYPLALQVAKKAFAIDDNQWTIETLGQAYYDMNELERADEQFQRLSNLHGQGWINGLRAIIAVNKNQWSDAQQFLALRDELVQKSVYTELQKNWIDAINHPEKKIQNTIESTPENTWQISVVQYFTQQTDRESLISLSSNTCEATEAHFYTAMKQWNEGQFVEAKKNLQTVLDLKAYSFTEYMWAKALLKSDLFKG